MYFTSFLPLAMLSLLATAQNMNSDEDVPPICQPICNGVIDIGRRCNDYFDNDQRALECMCDASGMPLYVPRCEACVADYLESRNDNIDEDEYKDIARLRSQCGFSTLTDSVSVSGAPSATPTALYHHLSNVSGGGVTGKAVPLAGVAAVLLGAAMLTL